MACAEKGPNRWLLDSGLVASAEVHVRLARGEAHASTTPAPVPASWALAAASYDLGRRIAAWTLRKDWNLAPLNSESSGLAKTETERVVEQGSVARQGRVAGIATVLGKFRSNARKGPTLFGGARPETHQRRFQGYCDFGQAKTGAGRKGGPGGVSCKDNIIYYPPYLPRTAYQIAIILSALVSLATWVDKTSCLCFCLRSCQLCVRMGNASSNVQDTPLCDFNKADRHICTRVPAESAGGRQGICSWDHNVALKKKIGKNKTGSPAPLRLVDARVSSSPSRAFNIRSPLAPRSYGLDTLHRKGRPVHRMHVARPPSARLETPRLSSRRHPHTSPEKASECFRERSEWVRREQSQPRRERR